MDGFTTRCLQTAGALFYVVVVISLVTILIYELIAIHKSERELNKEEK